VIHPDGSATLLGTGNAVRHAGHMRHRVGPVRDRAAGNRLRPQRPLPVHRPGCEHIHPDEDPLGDALTVNAVTGEATYTGTYRCT
jgi:hypothetical protein